MGQLKPYNLLYQHGKFCYNREPLPIEPDMNDCVQLPMETKESIYMAKVMVYKQALQHWKDSARQVVDQRKMAVAYSVNYFKNIKGPAELFEPTEGHIYQLDLENEPEVL